MVIFYSYGVLMLAISPFWAINDVGPGVSWVSSQSVLPALLPARLLRRFPVWKIFRIRSREALTRARR